MEGKVVSVVFCDRHFQHFLSLASVFSSWHYVHYQLQIRPNLVHFQRSTRDPYCIFVIFGGTFETQKREGKLCQERKRVIDDDLVGLAMNG
jgi:hypothetical protein